MINELIKFKSMLVSLSVLLLMACSDNIELVEKPIADPKIEHIKENILSVIAPSTNSSKIVDSLKGPHDAYNPHSQLTPEQLVKVALQHHQEGRPTEAIDTLDDAIKQYPDDSQLLFVRSQISGILGNTTAALRDVEQAITLSPDVAVYHVNRAQLYRKFGRYEEALSDLDKAISLDQNLLAAYFNRGALRYNDNDLEGALKDFNECIAINPHASAPYFNRATVLSELKRMEDALADIDRFMQISDSQDWKEIAQQMKDQWQSTDTHSQEIKG